MTGPSENLQCKNYQTLSVNGVPQDLFDYPLLLDMIFPGIPQLCSGVSFQKHPTLRMRQIS